MFITVLTTAREEGAGATFGAPESEEEALDLLEGEGENSGLNFINAAEGSSGRSADH
jgi:hypothetical protein